MTFDQILKRAKLLRRYKRFLADVELADGTILTIHCPNSGSMRSCSDPGSPVCYSTSANPNRKFPHTLEMVRSGRTWIGVNTSRTNALVAEAIEQGRIAQLGEFDAIRKEVKTSGGSRLDLMLEQGDRKIYIEVKNCSLVVGEQALFPDAVTSRGTRHLLELARLVEHGHRGVMFYLVQRSDARVFSAAAEIDPLYASTLAEVASRGVEVLAYQAAVTPESIEVTAELPVNLGS